MNKFFTINRKIIIDELITIAFVTMPALYSLSKGSSEFVAYLSSLPLDDFSQTYVTYLALVALPIIMLQIFFYKLRKYLKPFIKPAINSLDLFISTSRLLISLTFVAPLISILDGRYYAVGIVFFINGIILFIAVCFMSNGQEILEVEYYKILCRDNPIK